MVFFFSKSAMVWALAGPPVATAAGPPVLPCSANVNSDASKRLCVATPGK